MDTKIRVAVIFGGRSGEHEVSLQSARSVLSALDKGKYEVIPVGLSKKGQWLLGIEPDRAVEAGTIDRLMEMTGLEATSAFCQALWGEDPARAFDVVFPVLHGPYGEDGTVQGLLELAQIPYVGSGVLGSALGMDKVLMKTVFARHGLPQADFWYCFSRDWRQNPARVISEVENRLGYPCFVKPANLGSSVGISRAQNQQQLIAAMDLAVTYDRKIIIEQSIDGREIEVSILGNYDPMVSVPGEIIPSREFYDYEAKYLDNLSRLVIPAPLPEETVNRIEAIAIEAYQALDCAGFSRVDFFVTHSEGEVLINEINTIPGFTQISMYPKLWEASGISYPRLLDRLIGLALERSEEKRQLRV